MITGSGSNLLNALLVFIVIKEIPHHCSSVQATRGQRHIREHPQTMMEQNMDAG